MAMSVTSAVQAELERRAWAQADLARVLGWSVQALSEIMQGKRRIDAAMALDLSTVLRVPAQELLAMQAALDLRQAEQSANAATRLKLIAQRRDLEDAVPVRELVKRRVISGRDPQEQAEQVKALLEVDNLGDVPPYVVSTKRTRTGVPLTRAQKAWIALARRRARDVEATRYDEVGFHRLATALPRDIQDPSDFEALPEGFAAVGVRLVHIPAFPGGRIDGVSLGLGSAPMIALSGRGKRIDRVLFTLLHECAHVLSGHWRDGVVQVHDGSAVGDQELEDSVNHMAQSWILPEGLGTIGTINSASIDALARRSGVNRAVIIGQLQHLGVLPWASVLSRGLPNVEEALASWR